MEDEKVTGMPMIGDMAPTFSALTTQGEINFPKDYNGKWVVLFSYQMDFTPVCATELMQFAAMAKDFKELDTEIIGLSTASIYSHIAWHRKIKELVWKDIKHVEINFPIIADVSMEVSGKYAMLHPNTSMIYTVRAVFIIDPEGRIRAVLYYPVSIGRNINEIKRMVIALQKTDKEKAATPADWTPGEDVMLLPPQTLGAAADRVEKVNENMYCLDWFLAFRQTEDITQDKENEPEFNPYPSSYPMRRRNNNRR